MCALPAIKRERGDGGKREEVEEEDVYARGRSARDRMQRRLYANAGREFDRGPTFPLREGVRMHHPYLPPRACLCARARRVIPTMPCKREKGLVRVRDRVIDYV